MNKLATSSSAATSPLAFTPSEAIDEGEEEDEDDNTSRSTDKSKQKQSGDRRGSYSRRGSQSRSRRGSGKAASHHTGDDDDEEDDFFDDEADDGSEMGASPGSGSSTTGRSDGGKSWGALKDLLSVATALPRRLSRGPATASIAPSTAPDTVGGALPPFAGTTMPRARLHNQRSIRGRENLVQLENRHMVDPLGRFRLGWDVTSIVFILYNAVVLPVSG